MEHYVDTEELADQSTHFRGRKTIRFAPDSSIQLNPFDDTFCLQPLFGKPIQVPIAYESAGGLDSLQIRYKDLNNGVALLNFTRKDLKSFIVKDSRSDAEYDPASSNYRLLRIPVTRMGSYSIQSALDGKGKNIRPQRATVMIPMCPEASFGSADLSDKCVEDEVGGLSINVLGVPPFTLYYEEEINGQLSNLPSSVLVPEDEDFHSPLLAKELYTGQSAKGSPKYTTEDLKDISWARSRSIEVPIGKKRIDKAGEYIYTISKIIDGFGNVIKYSPDRNNKDTFISLRAHSMPVLNLVDAQPQKPILLGQDKFIDLRLSQAPPCISCEAPYTVVFKYIPPQNETDDNYEGQIFTKSFDFKTPARILVDKPGTYAVETASTRFCACKLGSSALNVRQAKLPNVNFAMDPIVDNCVGTTGFKFNFEFVGTAPFEIGYKISRLDPRDSDKILATERVSSLRSESTVLEYEFNPSSEGSYSIEFVSLSDKYYKNQIRFNHHEHRYVTYFKQRPRAYFGKGSKVLKLDACNGGSANVTLSLEGKAPFTVSYNLVSPQYKIETYTLRDIVDSVVTIRTPQLTKGGDYVLSLKNVTDSSSCAVDFKGQEVHIGVRNDVPQLRFASSQDYTLVQGKSLFVPLKSESSEPIELVYSQRSFDGREIQKTVTFDPTEGLTITEEGVYTLVSFTQGLCPGHISEDISIAVRYMDKPTLDITSINAKDGIFSMKSVCVDGGGSINFRASGIAPFVVRYSIRYPDGLIEQKTQQLPNRNFAIRLRTEKSGDYEYTIQGIYDSVYTSAILDQLTRQRQYKFGPIRVVNTVDPLPSAKITNKGENFQTCISSIHDIDQLTPLRLSLSGKLPMDVKLQVARDQEGPSETINLENLQSREVNLYAMYERMGLGMFYVTISEVKDSNGCVSKDFDEKEQVIIQVNDVPKIRQLLEESSIISEHGQLQIEKQDAGVVAPEVNYYCAGDYLTYMLNGAPPFMVYYEFNGKKQAVEVNSNYFKRKASRPGEMEILAVSDSSSKNCMVNFTSPAGNKRPDLMAKIFDLPSVEIVDGGSEEEDIYEGEQADITFRFTGQPPFKLTYIRTDLSEESKIVETEVVDNIFENEYKISANLEGTYEAIEIQDAFCVARNRRI
ncbi:DEKNAAC104114 [Brettanomyces naardenensis]|uniref:DEKNAAC104114 n=1 Tax=Brettanomyces naardenensis TaxID=13370 RepID=A0A448YQ22_BRENA|nr:DEKNAAC104114 [Brettanomyces naardenensis]